MHLQHGLLSWPPQGFGVPKALEGMLPSGGRPPSTKDCEERFFTQTLDHFRHAVGEKDEDSSNTFQQRYFVCSEFWEPENPKDGGAIGEEGTASRKGDASVGKTGRGGEHAPEGATGPIFFYTGNEADVSLYVGASGLMWENAPDFNALLVFAEHRFYGKSLPFGAPDKHREFLSTSQALADYACLVAGLKEGLGAEGSPVIAFGGSYGGMLASWFRLKYPHIVHGAVAASAPVLALEGLRHPIPDPKAFARTVTEAAGPAGGAAESCADNVRHAFSAILDSVIDQNIRGAGAEKKRRDVADTARHLHVCPGKEPRGDDAPLALAWWARSAFDYLAMGNFPYPTGYILNSGHNGVELPPWPLRKACSFLEDPGLHAAGDGVLLNALGSAISVYYNASGKLDCLNPADGVNNASSVDGANWNWQACTEMSMPMSTDGISDMFWLNEWDPRAQNHQCMEQFGVYPRPGWGAAEYGGYDTWSQVTNVVFSNGRLDPWSKMGVVDPERAGEGVEVIMMDQAAHHLDLFFSHPLDPQDVVDARRIEMDLVEQWVAQAYEMYSRGTIPDDVGSSKDEEESQDAKPSNWLEHVPSLTADW